MTAVANTKGLVEDAVLYIPRNTIHADPDQPRVKVDEELQASIDESGIIQAITVRPHPDIENEWMIVDGERRWLGGARLKTIPCRIRLDLEDPVDRLITQLSANTGKPLSPIEQARAFKLLLDDQDGLSQAELAKRLGIARSTIGDRIRLVELNPIWMKLIESGRLQISHAPLIHQYRAVPDDYQVKAAKNISAGEGWQIQKYDKGDVIPVAAFRKILHEAFKDYVVRMADVPSYKGPVLVIEEQDWHGAAVKKVRYAADITQWRPIKREAEKRAKKARESSAHRSNGGGRHEPPVQKALKSLAAAGIVVPERKPKGWNEKLHDGEVEIFGESGRGWADGIHPKVLLETIDPSKLIFLNGFGGDRLITTDAVAVSAAREAFQRHATEATKKKLASLREKLTPQVLAEYAVGGAGASYLVAALNPDRGAPKVVALALGLPIAGSPDDEQWAGEEGDTQILAGNPASNAETLLSALAAVRALDIKVPEGWEISQDINRGIENVPFQLPDPAKSKKQQKREARAAGRPVGDPSRAKSVDVGVMRAAVEAGVEEGELEAAIA